MLPRSSGFYPAPFEIITPYIQELNRVFNDLRDIFNKENCPIAEIYKEMK